MRYLSIKELPLEGKKVLIRVDFNVPLDQEGHITDPSRIRAAIPTILWALDHGAALILMSHLGRPKRPFDKAFSLKPVAKALEALLKRPVKLAPSCVGPETQALAKALKPGEVLLLENVRFHKEEEHPGDGSFAKELASLGDGFVNDAFGTAHRKHSSNWAITRFFKECSAAGLLLEKEISFLGEALQHPTRPFYAILGGAKISTKMGVIKALLQKVDALLIGGAMACTFLKALDIEVGSSLVEDEYVPLAKELLSLGEGRLFLPQDFVIAKECEPQAKVRLATLSSGIPKGFSAFDIGPQTIELYSEKILSANTLFWNGPLGVYEVEPFAKGTLSLAGVLCQTKALTVAGGGDLLAALQHVKGRENINHLSTGGGALLEYVEKGTLPAIESLTPSKQNA